MRHDVVFVLPDLGGGGAQRVMLNLARGIDPARFSLHLIAIGPGDALAGAIPGGVTVERLNAPRLRSALPALVRALRRRKPDVVVSTLGYVNLGLLAVKPLLGGARIVVREANRVAATIESLPAFVPARWLYARFYPCASAVIAQTGDIAAEIAGVAPGARVEILQNPIDEQGLRAAAVPVTRLPGPGLRLVAAGRLTRQKGFDRLIPLMKELPQDARLTIFGEGPDRAALESQITALGLSERVFLPGFSAGLSTAIAGADLFLLPSRWEGIANAALEALAVGTPVVASDEAHLEQVQREAVSGAVIIAPIGPQFVAAINGHQPQQMTASRPSLLPDGYRMGSVAARFNDLLSRVLATA